MIQVKLIDHGIVHPLAKAEHAAKTCYQGNIPEMRSGSDESTVKFVEGKLFRTGHHTTLQHSSFSFQIEGIAVGDVTFGLHLVNPFYDSDQRSGRFCSEMFLDPDFGLIESYLRFFWPDEDPEKMEAVMSFVRDGADLYRSNLGRATSLAERLLHEERPFASRSVLSSAGKIAQEQLRNFIPVVFPTALIHSVDGSALVALWESAWTPVMRYVTDRMRDEVLREYPEATFLFNPDRRRKGDWSPDFEPVHGMRCRDVPYLDLNVDPESRSFVVPDPDDTHPVDRLHFHPDFMENSVEDVDTTVWLSVATMGQDQRHRTVRRGAPKFTGDFYLPPIMEMLGLTEQAQQYLESWRDLVARHGVSRSLGTLVAPYGAMVTYRKKGSFNAVAHEQAKRLCWCAQQEIYEVSRQLRESVVSRSGNGDLIRMFEPPCYRTGKCAEGDRYCGRDISKRETREYFPGRKV